MPLQLLRYRPVGNDVLRPFLLLAVVLAFLGGPFFASQVSAADTGCSHAATVGSSGNCGDTGMTNADCAMSCGLGVCIPSGAAVFQPSVPARQLTSEASLPAGDRPSPPDPAPPKA